MRKKILFIIPYIPYPLDSGGNQAFFNMVEYLRHKMAVSVLLYPETGRRMQDVESLKKIWDNVDFFIYTPKTKTVRLPKIKHPFYYKWLQKIHASVTRKMNRQQIWTDETGEVVDLVRGKSTLFSSCFQPLDQGYVEYVSQVAHSGFDIIQVEFYELLSLGFLLPENVQTIFVHHELRYIRNEKEITLFREQTAGDRMLFHIAKDFERSALLKYKDVIVLTEVDRKIMEDFIGRKDHIYTSPAVVQVGDRLEQPFVPVQSGRLTFVGSEDHFPNLDAVAWFCHEVIPHLRKRHFSFTLQVIGKWRGECINRLQSEYPELKLAGYVEDLGSFLKGSVAVVPTRIGSGMRMKILDAVLSKVPFVTTAKGVEGIDFKDGEDCLIVDDPAGFAEAVIALSSNPQLQRQLVTHAEDSLRQVYNPGQMQERRLAVYEQILGDKVG